jgi:glutathione S-transferase
VFPQISIGITFGRVVAPRFGLPTDEAKIAAAIPQAIACLAEIVRLMGDGPYMAGDALSLADLMLLPHLAFLDEATEGERLLDPHPALRAWLARMYARASVQATTWDAVTAAAA